MKYNKDKLIEYLNDKWNGRNCPLCGKGPWNIQDNIFELREYNNGNLVVGQVPIIPLIPVTCANCGNTVFVNAILAGVLDNGSD